MTTTSEQSRSTDPGERLRSWELGTSRRQGPGSGRLPRVATTRLRSARESALQKMVNETLNDPGTLMDKPLLQRSSSRPSGPAPAPQQLRRLHRMVTRQPSPPVTGPASLRAAPLRGPASLRGTAAVRGPVARKIQRSRPTRSRGRDELPWLPSDALKPIPPRPEPRQVVEVKPPSRRRSVPPPLPLQAITQVPSLAPPQPGDPRLAAASQRKENPFEALFLADALPRHHDTVHLSYTGQLVNASDAPNHGPTPGWRVAYEKTRRTFGRLGKRITHKWQGLAHDHRTGRRVLAGVVVVLVAVLLIAADGMQPSSDTHVTQSFEADRVVDAEPVVITASVSR